MGKAKFVLGRIKGMDFRQFFETIDKMHKKSGKSKIFLFFDTIKTGLKYQAGYIDYMNAAMYNMTPEQKADVITRGVNNEYVVKYNDFDYTHFFINKAEFNEKFAKYMKRDWIVVKSEDDREAFNKICEGKDDIIIKPIDGTHGDGVSLWSAEPETFDKVKDRIPYLAEEKVIQRDEIAALNPTSVNTVRAVTFLKDGKAHLLAAYLRVGRGGLVDNFCNGGMLTPIDINTGVISCPAVDGENNVYPVHPITGESIIGFQIPCWDEIREMVLEAALIVPQVRYVGWDVSVSKKGPCLIEGNEYPGHVFFNFPEHHPDGTGQRHVFEEIMD